METKSVTTRLNDILHRRQLSSTESRRKILSLFLNSHDALTHGDIEREVGDKYDRVTIYRTLQTFEEKGIVHTIPTADNAVLYALCKDCEEGHQENMTYTLLRDFIKPLAFLVKPWCCLAPSW